MARARKPDKRKQMLDEVEEKHRQLEARVAALETERVQLIQRADMLSVVAEGLGAVMHHLQQQHQHEQHQHQRQNQQQMYHLKHRAQLLEQHIQMAIQHLNEPSCWPAEFLQVPASSSSSRCLQESGHRPCPTAEPKHYSTVLLQSMFEPAWVDQVLSMSQEDTVARLKQLVGQCAIMAVKAAAADSCTPAAAAAAEAASAGSSTAAYGGGGYATTDNCSLAMQTQHGWNEQQQQRQQLWGDLNQPAAAGIYGGGVSTHPSDAPAAAAARVDISSSLSAAGQQARPPPLEYTALMLTLLFFDEARFASIQYINLETGEHHVPPTEFWGSLGFQLQLDPQQIATLTAANDMMQAAVAPLYQSIGQGARQALEMTAQQEQQPQQRLLHAHSEVVQQQGSALSKIKMMALQMGIVTVNTLTMRQLALQQSLSYPYCPRMDLILQGMQQKGSSSS